MSDPIKGSEVIEDDHLKNPIKSAKDFVKAYKEIDEIVLKVTKDIVKMNKAATGGQTAKGMQDISKALIASTDARKKSIVVDKEKLAVDKQLKAATEANVKAKLKLQRANQQQRKALKDIIILEDQEATVTEKLLATNRQLSRERDKLSGATRKQRKEIKALNKSIDANNAKINKNADALKKQRLGIGGYSKAVGGLRNSLAKLGLAIGVFTILKDAFNITKDFDQAQANLSSVLGVTREEMSALTEQAKELGATTKFTASQVSELQISFAKLGFSEKEISGVTEATLQLASAAGTELGNAATIVGSTLRAFNLNVSNTQRLVDVMAKSFSSSSLDIDKFSSAMSNVAPAAAAIGLTIEETTALIGTLTDAGIDASSAGTGLRNMFLDAKKQGIDFDDALEKIANSTDKLGTSFDIFGKKGSTLGVILAENQAATAGLTKTLEGAGGAAEEMADKQLDTLQGSLDLLRSAWEGFILGADGASGASEKLKNIVKFLADNLNTILNTIGTIIAAFGAYKAITTAISVVQKSMAIITNIWTAAQWLLNIALNANPIGVMVIFVLALIAAVTAIIALLDSWSSSTKKLTDIQKRNNLINEQALAIGKEILAQNKEEIADVSVLIDALIDENTTREEKNEIIAKLNEDYPELIGNIDLESASTERLISLKKQLITQILNEAIERKKAEALALITGQIIDKELKKIGAGETGVKQLQKEIDELAASIPLIEEIAAKVKASVQDTVEGIDLSGAFRDENDKIRKLQAEISTLNRKLSIARTEEERKAIRKRINTVQTELDRELGIRTQMLDDALDKEKEVNAEGVEDFKKSEKAKTVKKKTQVELNEQAFSDLLAQNKQNLKILEIQAREDGKSKEEIEEILRVRRLKNAQTERDTALRLFGVFSDEFIDADLNLLRTIEDNRKDSGKTQEEINQQTFDDILDANAENLKRLKSQLLSEGKSREEIDEILAQARIDQLEQEMEDALRIFGEGSEEFLDAKLAFQIAEQNLDDIAESKRIKALKEAAKKTVDIFKDIADKKIEQIEREKEARLGEIAASEEEVTRLQQIGTANAAEAIKAEKISQAKDKLAIEALEKKKKGLLITIAGLERVSQLIGSGDQSPFKTAGNEIKGFIEGLKGFDLGTDSTVANALGKPHLNTKKDGYIARLGGDEMVMSTKKSLALQKAGIGTTDDLFSNAMKWQNRGMMHSAMAVKTEKSFNDRRMVDKLDKVVDAVNNIEIIHQDFDFKNFVKTTTKKGSINRTHYDNPDLSL